MCAAAVQLLPAQDVTPPTIASVTSTTADGTYKVDSVINITVNFSESVTLTDANLIVVLETGDTDREVAIGPFGTLASSANTTYTVERGDESSDLSVNSISLSGTGDSPALKDSAGNAMIDFSIPDGSNLDDFSDIAIDAVPPSVPSGLTAEADGESVSLQWRPNSEGDFGKYRLFGGQSEAPTTVIDSTQSVDQTSVTVSDLLNDTTYYFRLSALDTLGNESDYSNEVSAVPFSPPMAGEIRDGTSSDVDWWNSSTTLSANWDNFEDNGAVSYQYAIGSSPTTLSNVVPWIVIGGDTSVTATGLNLIQGSTYYVSVRGTDFTDKSDTTTSDGVTIDLTEPNTGTVNDGSDVPGTDRAFTGSEQSLSANWVGFDDELSGIAWFKYAISAGDTVLADSTVTDSVVTHTEPLFEHGVTYIFSITATDSAGNVSDSSRSDGVTVDLVPPVPGVVHDGLTEELDWTTDSTSLASTWTGFADNVSGVDTFQYAIGTAAGDSDAVGWTGTGTDTFFTRSDLSLLDATTYYVSVRAFDHVGNRSDPATSDGITVDVTPPFVESLQPDTLLLTSPTDTLRVVARFSEAVGILEVDIGSVYEDSVHFLVDHEVDTVTISVPAPLVSLDTLRIELKNITDLRGLVTDSLVYEFHTGLLADFNDDLKVDLDDMTIFVSQWPDVDIGPVSGTIPHFKPEMDGVTNLRDSMAFARMWRWWHDQSDTLFLHRQAAGDEVSVQVNGLTISIHVPPNAAAGQIAVRVKPLGTIIHPPQTGASSDLMVLTHVNPDLGQAVVEFGVLSPSPQARTWTFTLEDTGRSMENPLVSYIFFSRSKEILSSGTNKVELNPVPESVSLGQNYPNPFNPTTVIPFALPEEAFVHIRVYDILGRQVRTLENREFPAGFHASVWDGRDEWGEVVSSGLYLVHFRAGTSMFIRKMILLR